MYFLSKFNTDLQTLHKDSEDQFLRHLGVQNGNVRMFAKNFLAAGRGANDITKLSKILGNNLNSTYEELSEEKKEDANKLLRDLVDKLFEGTTVIEDAKGITKTSKSEFKALEKEFKGLRSQLSTAISSADSDYFINKISSDVGKFKINVKLKGENNKLTDLDKFSNEYLANKKIEDDELKRINELLTDYINNPSLLRDVIDKLNTPRNSGGSTRTKDLNFKAIKGLVLQCADSTVKLSNIQQGDKINPEPLKRIVKMLIGKTSKISENTIEKYTKDSIDDARGSIFYKLCKKLFEEGSLSDNKEYQEFILLLIDIFPELNS